MTSSLYCVRNAKEFFRNLKSPKQLYSEGKQRQSVGGMGAVEIDKQFFFVPAKSLMGKSE